MPAQSAGCQILFMPQKQFRSSFRNNRFPLLLCLAQIELIYCRGVKIQTHSGPVTGFSSSVATSEATVIIASGTLQRFRDEHCSSFELIGCEYRRFLGLPQKGLLQKLFGF